MQAHTQLPSQVSGAQLGGVPQQTMTTAPSSQGVVRRRSWHSDADFNLRRLVVEKILQVCQRKKNMTSPDMQHKLPLFVKRLEESLYQDASTREEYGDFSTLEQRMQIAGKKMASLRANMSVAPRGMNMAASSMIPTPGMPTMIPTPGHEIPTNFNASNFNYSGTDSVLAVSRGNISNMIPTPGLSTPFQGNSSLTNVDAEKIGMPQAYQQEPITSEMTGHASGRINGSQKLGFHSQPNLSTVSPVYPNSSLYMNSNNTSARCQQQQLNQFQQQHVPMPGFSPGSVSMHSRGSSKMIPVPGMSLAQTTNHQLQQLQGKGGSTSKSMQQQSQLLNGKAPLQPMCEPDSSMAMDVEGNHILPSVNQSLSKGLHQCQPVFPAEGCQNVQGSAGAQSHQSQTDHQQGTLSQANQYNLLQASSSSETGMKVFNTDDAGEPHRLDQKLANHTVPESQGCGERGSNPLRFSFNLISDQQRAQIARQQRWILFLRHASKCSAPQGQCQTSPNCEGAKQLYAHILTCRVRDCQFPRCVASRNLLRHYQTCKQPTCPLCGPLRQKMQIHSDQTKSAHVNVHGLTGKLATPGSFPGTMHGQLQVNRNQASPAVASESHQPPLKRVKLEPWVQNSSGYSMDSEVSQAVSVMKGETDVASEGSGSCRDMKPEAGLSSTDIQNEAKVKLEELNKSEEQKIRVDDVQATLHGAIHSAFPSKYIDQGNHEMKSEADVNSSSDQGNAKSGKSKNRGVSLIELFTPEQIREHIKSLRQWVGQSKAKAEKNQALEHQMNENSCQLCAVETLTYEPPPIYCTPCGARIKRNAFYCTMQCGETRHYFCMPCCNDTRGDSLVVDGQTYLKAKLEKRRNDEETEEPWVQCDKCEKWQHQVCALFNMRRNEGGQAEYTCPNCLLIEMGKGERKPLPQSAVLGAKDLPKTFLSDHIEQRLARRLKQERLERARSQGKGYNEVPGAESLVVRVVSSVDKKLEVKPKFLEMFQEEDYPKEYPYKSKVLLLFQRIEGVEVCLFGMYVQEFGAEAEQPNQRRVYLSYLDSVKYFRPDVRTTSGEALRTFVYHEILIGYLDYCKKRGFTSCYIWACPPLKGEDYILYCHPEIQKTPKSDKLREWYLAMLSKAANEGVVAEVTNMYDYFFVSSGETKAKVTAARLPYFDGDYWPGAAEDMITILQKEDIGPKQSRRGKTKGAGKRATKTTAYSELASNMSRDLQLMQKLGESILPMKDDFIMVHMQHACTQCCNFILSGYRWTCKQCKSFNLCDRCYAVEQKLDESARHPISCKEAHQLYPVPTNENLPDTKDKDEIMESEFFDTRQAFLSLCQGNHYQYDTLRRAKNSSMMVLYHLHNPTAPAYVTTCNVCHRDIETGQGWRCETCPDFDICNQCYSQDDSVKHPHKLSPHPSATDIDAQSKEARQQRVIQLRKMLELLVHASKCGSATQCQYPNCLRVKALFRHGLACKTRASGGCQLCKRMWHLLQLHSRACKEPECRVPRCKDLKEHLRRLQQQQELHRRNAVMEMMRQRTAGTST